MSKMRVRERANNAGSIILFVVAFLAVLAMIPLSMNLLKLTSQQAQSQINFTAQANNVARAGLTDAISWFRRQTTQPVRSGVPPSLYAWADGAFYPRLSTSTADTIDESIGLVKEYQLTESGLLWARYEVRRQQDTATNAVDPKAVHDITGMRCEGHVAGEGLAWYVESAGIVYRKFDAAKNFDEAPNEVVSRARVSTEIRRLALSLPLNAAVIVSTRNLVSLASNTKVVGGNNAGIGYYGGNSNPSTSGGSSYTGIPAISDIDGIGTNGTFDVQTILGVTENELKLMADISVNSLSELASDYPAMAVVFIKGDATFDSSHPLRGGGILYVKGNLTIQTTSNTLFSGFIFVTGNASILGDNLISGSIAVKGSLSINGSGVGVPEIDYDSTILDSVRQQVAQYRENKATTYTFTALQ